MKKITCLILLVIMTYCGFAEENQIFTVTADAIVRVVPDKVVLRIGVETRGENLSAIRKTNFDIIKSTIEILKKNGVEDRYIGTDHVNIQTYYEDSRYRDLRFVISQSLTVIITDISKYDEILTEVVEAGINQVYSIEFQTDELKKFRYEARSLAIAAAKERAEFLAREAGFKLGKIINLRESTNNYYGLSRTSNRGGMSQSNIQIDSENSGESDTSDTLAPGMISIRSDITLYYTVEE